MFRIESWKYSKIPALLLLSAAVFILALMAPPVETCKANSGPPPSIVIIVPYAPDDLEISIVGRDVEPDIINKAFETYYAFYMYDLKLSEYTVRVTTDEGSFDTLFKVHTKSYSNYFTLDLGKQLYSSGIPVSRSISLISIRVIVTLLLEALVFWGFGFRERKSWIAFFAINLVTQGMLNIWLDTSFNPISSYVIFVLLFVEILVFVVEMLAFSALVREHSLLITNVYVICANVLSLVAGCFLLTVLPI